MTRRRWWWIGLVDILMLAGAVAGCSGGGDHHEGPPMSGGCVLVGEQEPNATPRTAQFLGDLCVGDYVAVAGGSVVDPVDVDSYRALIPESLNLVMTLDHSPFVDFDLLLFDADTGQLILDCGLNVVPEVCVIPFVVLSRDIAVDIVITSVVGAGTYTLTLDTQ
jgi:hypothetical protein